MISARGPDSASADEPGIDVRAPLLHVARQSPDSSTPCRPASAEASNRAVGSASNAFPSGLLPSRVGMAKPAIPQARDRAEVLFGVYTPGMGHERRFPGTSGNGRLKRARECLLKVMTADRALAHRTSGTGGFQPLANDWMATSRAFETCRPTMRLSAIRVPAQPVDATQALNLSAGVSNCKVSRGRSFS